MAALSHKGEVKYAAYCSLANPALADVQFRQDLRDWVRKGQEAGLDRGDLETVVDSVLDGAYATGRA